MSIELEQIWENEDAWIRARYSPEFIRYLQLTLPPGHKPDREIALAGDALRRTPIVEAILRHQQPNGSWPLGGPPWFRIYPRPLLVLHEYGLRDDVVAVRGVEHLLSLFENRRFVWPRREPHDPIEFYVAFQGRCLQVLTRAGLSDDPRIRELVDALLERQRWDGGWSVKPLWMYRADEVRPDPPPSCWICTMEVMKGLGPLIRGRADVISRTLQFWEANLNPADAGLLLTILGEANLNPADVGLLLAILEFCGRVGLRVVDPQTYRFLTLLEKARGQEGRFPALPDYFEVMATHVKWLVGASTGQMAENGS